jgi:hypothetical protein
MAVVGHRWRTEVRRYESWVKFRFKVNHARLNKSRRPLQIQRPRRLAWPGPKRDWERLMDCMEYLDWTLFVGAGKVNMPIISPTW